MKDAVAPYSEYRELLEDIDQIGADSGDGEEKTLGKLLILRRPDAKVFREQILPEF